MAMGMEGSFALRLGEVACSAGVLLFMLTDEAAFYRRYTSFCFLVIVTGLVIPWSLVLAMVDRSIDRMEAPIPRPCVILMVAVIDWIFAFMLLGASCSTAFSTGFLFPDVHSYYNKALCTLIYYVSAFLALLCYIMFFAGALSNVFIVPSL
ncbi:PREDICTED: CASP-like protein 5C1 [Ipomoea nil]|uniref:CASP-like protein 5C1 n=1 Tax=Ipomoea nil TaxID=35883 RepID=UPI0009014326|nr:PREDICTED: CASP-like protein 5C1 [Ipomoea nil]